MYIFLDVFVGGSELHFILLYHLDPSSPTWILNVYFQLGLEVQTLIQLLSVTKDAGKVRDGM